MQSLLRSVQITHPIAEIGDEDLLVLARNGFGDAYVELCRRHREMVLRVVNRIMRNTEDSEDVIQESVLKAYLHLSSFDGRSQFSTWLTRIAINTALMAKRKALTRPTESLDDCRPHGRSPLEVIESGSLNPEDQAIRLDQRVRMFQAIEGLPPTLRQVLEVRLSGDRSVREAADAMGISVAAAKSRLLRAQNQIISRMGSRRGRLSPARPGSRHNEMF